MRRLGTALLSASLLVGCGPSSSEPSPEPEQQQASPLTTTDVDVAPECQGILTFVNTAPFATLDDYLPNDVVTNLVARRATAPFVSLADVNSVSLVGDTRLAQLEAGARAQGFITSGCVGILDQLAVSVDDAAAIVHLVNTVDADTMFIVLPNAWNGASTLLNLRPFTSVQAISNAYGIGPASLRNLRNAANIGYSLEMLSTAVNALPDDLPSVNLILGFNAQNVLEGAYGNDRNNGGECWGYAPGTLPNSNWTVHTAPATAAQVYSDVNSVVSFADYIGDIDADVITDGMADLQTRIAGRTFKGCRLSYQDGPWAGIVVNFFLDTSSNFKVLTRWHWVE
ncbi:hypothetical protein LZ198_07950 [Myxococcus sp. K15C18031901]|uniref:hypothetical protein n=1 Tax=Myxococcus dinghuensis TaxID=2906761 RepID=UPI0020A74A09|nr:hypothetical protein [Myxococcus dinghuensis]MCP3098806.1 hypothetical protein [Myxococcus dinghuensis]